MSTLEIIEQRRASAKTRSDTRRTTRRRLAPSTSPRKMKIVFNSPRCHSQDENKLFVVKGGEIEQERYECISQQAQCHNQDAAFLVIKRHTSPQVLKFGITPKAGSRVRKVHLDLMDEDILPQWLDEIKDRCPKLQELSISLSDQDGELPASLRRFLILYKIPHLECLDGVEVTNKERNFSSQRILHAQIAECLAEDKTSEIMNQLSMVLLEYQNQQRRISGHEFSHENISFLATFLLWIDGTIRHFLRILCSFICVLRISFQAIHACQVLLLECLLRPLRHAVGLCLGRYSFHYSFFIQGNVSKRIKFE